MLCSRLLAPTVVLFSQVLMMAEEKGKGSGHAAKSPKLASVRTIRAQRVEGRTVLDGRLDEPFWQRADKASDFSVIYSSKTAAVRKTVGRVAYDDDNLFVGVDCLEPRMDLLKRITAKSSGKFDYHEGETVEIFLDVAHNRKEFFQILVNTNGSWVTHTTQAMQLRNVEIYPAVQFREDGFSIEVKIPFAVLHLRPGQNRTWGFNITRARMIEGIPGKDVNPNQVYSVWQNTGGPFRRPDRFGALRVEAGLSAFHYDVSILETAGGPQLELANRTGKEQRIRLELGSGDASKPHVQEMSLKPEKDRTIDLPLKNGSINVDVALAEARTGRVVYQGGTRLAEVAETEKLTPELSDLKRRGYVVFSRSYLERGSHRSVPTPGQLKRPLQLFAAPGEYEPVSMAVHAGRDLSALRIGLAGDLKSKTGDVIPKEAVEIRVVESMKCWFSPTEYKKTECFLIRNRERDIAANTTQRYWLTVHVPARARPGLYRSNIRIEPAGAEASELPLSLEVLPLRLGPPEGMNYFMYFRPRFLPDSMRTKEHWRRILVDMREHGMTSFTMYAYPVGSVDRDKVEALSMTDQMKLAEETGLLREWSAVPWMGAEGYSVDGWRMVHSQATSRHWSELLWYLVDEPVAGRYERVEKSFAKVEDFQARFPGSRFRTTTAGASNPEVCHLYDVWIAGTAGVDDEALTKARTMGKELWTYDCGLGPVDAQTDRYYFGLWCWKSGAKGASHWAYYDGSATTRFNTQATWTGTPKDLTDHTHRFNYAYPMKDELVPTIGWEAVREGIDDYRYFHTLKKAIEQAEKKGIDAGLIKGARAALDEVKDAIHIANYGKAVVRDKARNLVRYFERLPPEPDLKPDDYNRLRYGVAQQIVLLQHALGVDLTAAHSPTDARHSEAGKSANPSGKTVSASRPSTVVLVPGESLWDSCDDLEAMNISYAQKVWHPKSFREMRIGKLTIDTRNKVEGSGSIRWQLTKSDVTQALKKTSKLPWAGIHKLYGKDWSPYAEFSFQVRCTSARHPPIYCQLIGANAPLIRILNRNETTDGWKEVQWDQSKLDIGVSKKYGRIMNYVRFFTPTGGLRDDDVIDLNLDNFRLRTKDEPSERK